MSRLVCLCVYFTVMSGLYISPLFIKSPCVIEAEYVPQKPKIFAHRGASGVRIIFLVDTVEIKWCGSSLDKGYNIGWF